MWTEDISLVGFNDLPYAAMHAPTLSTIRLPSYDMGFMAAETLVRTIWEAPEENKTVTLEPKLIVRESSDGNKSE